MERSPDVDREISSTGADAKAAFESRDQKTRDRHQSLTDQTGGGHDALTLAIERLERALAEAGIHREAAWSSRASMALETVRLAIESHAAETEEKNGLFDEIESTEPRLARRVAALRQQHPSLASRASALADLLGVSEKTDVKELRKHAARLLGDLRTHRADEADLIYEAFWMEMGAAD